MANVNEGEREWTIMTAHKRRTSSDGQSVGVSSWVRGPALSAPIDVVPTEALREAERDLLAVVDMWRGRFEDAASRETGLHEALRKETGALREAEAEVARLREVLDRFGGHRGDCNVIAGAPDCNCGFDEAYVRVRQAARGSESESKTGGQRMRVYIAGPMAGLPDHNFPAFHAAAKRLRALGHEVLSPAEKAGEQAAVAAISEGLAFRETQTYRDFLKADLRMVLDADAIQLLPGWENSRGAQLEVNVARAVGIAVLAPESGLDGDGR